MKFIHLSKVNNITTLHPNISKLIIHGWENTSIPRISFAPTIDQCIIALNVLGYQFITGNNFIDYNIYTPKSKLDEKYCISNEEINTKKYCYDSHITGESWYLTKCPVENIGKVRIYKNIIKSVEFKPLCVGNKNWLLPNGNIITHFLKYEVL